MGVESARPVLMAGPLRLVYRAGVSHEGGSGQADDAGSGNGLFQQHLELLDFFLAHRAAVVERIEGLLNAQRKPLEYLRNGALLFRLIEDAFFIGATSGQARLRGQLEAAHWAQGFKPREIPGLHNGLIDPAEMMVRGFHLWQQTRWPGRNGRLRFAHTLFNLSVLRSLELLSMRVWDDGDGADDRLSQVQSRLDRLWATSPSDQPTFVRDARWLIQLAQSPATDDLGAYFEVARRVAEQLPEAARIGVHEAGVCMAAGHLRSQIRYQAISRSAPLTDHGLILHTRTTNALDFALLIQELVPLLAAYDRACDEADPARRIALAGVICQGVSPDPELFVTRVDLLGPYSMLEHLFVTTGDESRVAYTSMGRRHLELLHRYEAGIDRAAARLLEDCARLRPVAGSYSPFGALYGFSTDLIEHMALRTLQPDAVHHLGIEDVFTPGEANGEKLAWVSGWRKLPHLTADVAKLFDYPQQFAEDIFDRLERVLRQRVEATAAPVTGRLRLASGDAVDDAPEAAPALPIDYIRSSDPQLVAARRAERADESALLAARREGKYLVSYRTPGGWAAIAKSVVTDVCGTGRDATITGLPVEAAATLALMGPRLVVPATLTPAG